MIQSTESEGIVCFGEIMMRMTPSGAHERLEQAHQFNISFAGAEANIASSLARFGHAAWVVTRFPDNPLGRQATDTLRSQHVNTEFILCEGSRIGTYYLETGASMRPSQVIYDRDHSAFAHIKPEMFDWEKIFRGKTFFVTTGITPALSEGCAQATYDAITTAHKMGVKVCFDFNYRRSLWSRDKARQEMTRYLPYISLLFGNAGSALDILDIDTFSYCRQQGISEVEALPYLANEIRKLADIDQIALTVREHMSASENQWCSMLFDRHGEYQSRSYHLKIVDRVGGGDAFAAGVIHGIARNWEPQKTIEFATAASALKHTIPGDLNLVDEHEVLDLVEGDGSGRVKR